VGQGAFNEQKFAKKAMEGNQFEIQLGQLAQQKSQNEEVKRLAQMLVQDHQQANQKLMQASSGQSGQPAAAGQAGQPGAQAGQPGAQAAGSPSSGSQQLGPVHQAMMSEYQQLQGAEFDQAYVYGQLAGHIKSILWYREASTQAQNPRIKEYATQSLPKLQAHFQQIQQLAGWDEATTASGSIPAERSSPRSDAADRQSTGSDTAQEVKGALGGTNSTSTDRNAASSGASQERTGGQDR
jgi:predicted outer membrane protein